MAKACFYWGYYPCRRNRGEGILLSSFKGSLTSLPLSHFLPISLAGLTPVLLNLMKDFSVLENLCLNAFDGFAQNRFPQLAFPDNNDEPAFGLQLSPHLLVSFLVTGYLCLPEIRIRLGNCVVFTVGMAMPEASVHENGSMIFGQDDIGRARKRPYVHPVAESAMPEAKAQFKLRFC